MTDIVRANCDAGEDGLKAGSRRSEVRSRGDHEVGELISEVGSLKSQSKYIFDRINRINRMKNL